MAPKKAEEIAKLRKEVEQVQSSAQCTVVNLGGLVLIAQLSGQSNIQTGVRSYTIAFTTVQTTTFSTVHCVQFGAWSSSVMFVTC